MDDSEQVTSRVTYVYVKPYHHAHTTKHGASNWSWTKLWQKVHGLPIPLCCPCANDPPNGDFPHVMNRDVGAHVKLREPENEKEIPAIIPACNGCNRKDRALHWNSKAILLRRDKYFFGKLYLLEQKSGLYWEEVHHVRHHKGFTYVKGKVKGEPLGFGSMTKAAIVKEYAEDLIDYYKSQDRSEETAETITAEFICNTYTKDAIQNIIGNLYGAGTRFVGVRGPYPLRNPNQNFLSTEFIKRSPRNEKFNPDGKLTLQTLQGEWEYVDETQFVYDLLRPAEKNNFTLTCKHNMDREKFTQDVINQVKPGVEATRRRKSYARHTRTDHP